MPKKKSHDTNAGGASSSIVAVKNPPAAEVTATVQVATKSRRRNRRSRRQASSVKAKNDPSTAMEEPAKTEDTTSPAGNTTDAKEPTKDFMETFENQMLGDYLLFQFELAAKGDLGGAIQLQRRCGGC
ncbi:hypothetical protein FN846DRAFT_906755 [Sphaerosporella brunnea]|uniref:Uncharacterized protein n=1 Tax=Sphaerosporella brunnea TaxID=1250544 RepID=A0A5J5EY46_9PEZI|nr:hypothetical protein FN846DRAFT_906755 [Sphaerosporella brunnea]